MATVAFADVKVRYLDIWPAGVTDAVVTALCARALTLIDSKSGEMGTFDHTTANGIELGVDVVWNLIEKGIWAHTGGYETGFPPPKIFSAEMEKRLETILQDEGVDLIDSHDYDAD